jgi:serine/threonine-protein kinase
MTGRGLTTSSIASLALAGAAFAAAPPAWAGPTPEVAAAQALFDEARGLMARGKYADACVDLEQSERLDPGVGTLLNLGDCYEHLHRLASAWDAFLDAVVEAQRAGEKDREKEARGRAAALTPRLSRIAVLLPSVPIEGLSVVRDRVRVPDSQIAVAAPVDAGAHTVEVTVPGHGTWKTQVSVTGEGTTSTVSIPVLLESAPAAKEEATVFATTEPAHPLGVQRTAALVSAGVGLTSLVIGTGFLIAAAAKNADADSLCPSNACTSVAAVRTSQGATLDANVATGTLVAGAVAAAIGAVLWFTVRHEKAVTTASKTASLDVGAGPGMLQLRGTW